jgi:hypothetical protein
MEEQKMEKQNDAPDDQRKENSGTTNPVLRFLQNLYSSFVYPFPGCPHCNTRQRILHFTQILWLIGLAIMGNTLINSVDHDIESQCCQSLKIMQARAALLYNPATTYRETWNITELPLTPSILEMVSTTTTTLMTCPVCEQVTCPPEIKCETCQTCPVCEPSIPESVKEKARNMRWANPTSPCAQFGYAAGKTDCMSIVGVGKTFNGQPNYGSAGTVMLPEQFNASLYCFMKQSSASSNQYGFPLNNSLWDWEKINNTEDLWVERSGT